METFVQTDNDRAAELRARNREVGEFVSEIPARKPKAPPTLDEAYAKYKDGKGLGRADMFGLVIDAIKELQARIGGVDEAAVSGLDVRVSGLETVIGNALAKAVAPEPVAASMGLASAAINERLSPTPSGEPIAPKRGRPKKDAV